MLVFHGTSLFGKVDQVKGLFHVATLFFHVNWIPIIPKTSYLIFEGARAKRGPQGVTIGLCGKSVLFAWLRLFALVGGCFVLPGICVALERGPAGQVLTVAAFVIPILSLTFFILSYRLSRARPERALELAALAGIGPHELAQFFAEHLTPEDEDRLRNLVAEPDSLHPSP